jgi:CMP-N,N'-diacetyllegionaminic acid synthase
MGSKGVANKNIRLVAGLPLIVHSIRQARESGLFSVLAVSSDSEAILEIAASEGVEHCIRRPDALATDHAAKIPAIQHCVGEVERIGGQKFHVVVDLDSTSPLRSSADIKGAVNLLESRGVSNVITGALARRSPYFNLVELDEGGVPRLAKSLGTQIVRRQDAPKCFDMNASIYVWRRDALLARGRVFDSDTLLFEMPEERSIDIDSELDLKVVEMLMNDRSPS